MMASSLILGLEKMIQENGDCEVVYGAGLHDGDYLGSRYLDVVGVEMSGLNSPHPLFILQCWWRPRAKIEEKANA